MRGLPEKFTFRPEKPVENVQLHAEPGATRVLSDGEGRWLLRDRAPWDNGVIDVALPARASVTGVAVDGRPVADYTVRELGSLKRVRFRMPVADGGRCAVRIGYEPLAKARNVECIAHFPSGSIERTRSPAHLAELLKTMNVTIALPHVHSAHDDRKHDRGADRCCWRRSINGPRRRRPPRGIPGNPAARSWFAVIWLILFWMYRTKSFIKV